MSLSPNSELRPTPERVRETLFNWLAHDVVGAKCLDLFAGSGAIGIEALSRGAKFVDFVELDRSSAKQIESSLRTLDADADRFKVQAQAAEKMLERSLKNEESFDIVFLDPPFKKNWWNKVVTQVLAVTHEASLIYLEIEKEAESIDLPENWSIFREKTAGQVRYYLLKQDAE